MYLYAEIISVCFNRSGFNLLIKKKKPFCRFYPSEILSMLGSVWNYAVKLVNNRKYVVIFWNCVNLLSLSPGPSQTFLYQFTNTILHTQNKSSIAEEKALTTGEVENGNNLCDVFSFSIWSSLLYFLQDIKTFSDLSESERDQIDRSKSHAAFSCSYRQAQTNRYAFKITR